MPRVISGCCGGRKLESPTNRGTRPTADRVKEGLFSSLQSRLDWSGCRVLELYAGSGQLGIEALSRGAASVVFVERDPGCCRLIQRNLRLCGFAEGQTAVLRMDALRALERFMTERCRFDLVLADPPYAEAAAFLAAAAPLLSAGALAAEALFCLEYEKGSLDADAVKGLRCVKNCSYGTTMVSCFALETGDKVCVF